MTTVPAQDILTNLARLHERVAAACRRAGRSPETVTLVGASKTVVPETMAAAHAAGLRDFGENYVQEAAAKFPTLAGLTPPPVRHLIGHLQTNKAREALGLFDVFQSVDSVRLAEAMSRRADGRTVTVYLEVNVTGEASKEGFALSELPAAAARMRELPGLALAGLMTVAPEASDSEAVRPVFRQLRQAAAALGLTGLSMGMTGDFEVAIEEGATLVRIGRALFGPRPAPHS